MQNGKFSVLHHTPPDSPRLYMEGIDQATVARILAVVEKRKTSEIDHAPPDSPRLYAGTTPCVRGGDARCKKEKFLFCTATPCVRGGDYSDPFVKPSTCVIRVGGKSLAFIDFKRS